VGLTTQVPWSKNQQWMQLLANSGTPLFISAQPEAVGPEQKKLIKECFTMAARQWPVGQAVDWMDTLTPATWKLHDRIWHFDWT
jgi:alpha-galactosidase